MLFLFLALYAALGVGCLVLGIRRSNRTAVVCGIIAIGLAVASLTVGILYAMNAAHWTISVLQALLSPMPESLLQPGSLEGAGAGSGLPVIAFATLELIAAIVLWAVPVLGIIAATRASRREPAA